MFTVLVGSLAVAVIEYLIFSTEWQLQEFMSDSKLEFFFLSIPYLWILLFTILLLVAWQEVRHTKHGYRYGLLTIILVLVSISVVTGTALYAVGAGADIDDNLSTKFPNYTKHIHATTVGWHKPGKGQILGTITNTPVTSTFRIRDINGTEWVVLTNTNTITSFIEATTNTRVRIFGEQEANEIRASYILPTTIPKEHIEQMKRELFETKKRLIEKRKKAAKSILDLNRIPVNTIRIEQFTDLQSN